MAFKTKVQENLNIGLHAIDVENTSELNNVFDDFRLIGRGYGNVSNLQVIIIQIINKIDKMNGKIGFTFSGNEEENMSSNIRKTEQNGNYIGDFETSNINNKITVIYEIMRNI